MDHGKLKKKNNKKHHLIRLHSLVLTVLLMLWNVVLDTWISLKDTIPFVCSPALYTVTLSSFNSLHVCLIYWPGTRNVNWMTHFPSICMPLCLFKLLQYYFPSWTDVHTLTFRPHTMAMKHINSTRWNVSNWSWNSCYEFFFSESKFYWVPEPPIFYWWTLVGLLTHSSLKETGLIQKFKTGCMHAHAMSKIPCDISLNWYGMWFWNYNFNDLIICHVLRITDLTLNIPTLRRDAVTLLLLALLLTFLPPSFDP